MQRHCGGGWGNVPVPSAQPRLAAAGGRWQLAVQAGVRGENSRLRSTVACADVIIATRTRPGNCRRCNFIIFLGNRTRLIGDNVGSLPFGAPGNKASTIAGHPAYVPTVFPPCYRRSDAVLPASKLDRYKRLQRRRAVLQAPTSKSAITATVDSFEDSSTDLADEIIASPEETGTSASVMTQTDADFNGGVCTLFLSATAEGVAISTLLRKVYKQVPL
ncbi:hypothetical protein HPB49_006492 [Dermacentor silvarum]|uniref:Uncharacterized protein n=1 Tax=Dermacentor silvarum TaxID=543639 RepID=A0ACB8CDR5_DERSI|nr:hypothetical protein HPB49_006492 [Dermacentor silvarum]